MRLVPGRVTLADLESVWRGGEAALDPSARAGVEAAAARVAAAVAAGVPVYGVNTGFGKLASVTIPAGDTARLQRNLILSHCSGVGAATPAPVVRLMMALKLVSLGRGASGVRWAIVALIEGMLAKGVVPVVPVQGSVGASGDLAPLAHMAAVMIGAGEAEVGGVRMAGGAALSTAGLAPVELAAKEGLALINGTQFSCAWALAGLFGAWRAAQNALLVSCLSTDAIMGSTAPLREEIHRLRGHRGQVEAAAAMRAVMAGSAIRESHREGDTRVQDPYCIRCQPQVTGAAMDLLRQAAGTLEIEANAATDNPLVLGDAIVSGGNFHAEPVAFAADVIALAVAEIGAIAQRRVALMVDPTLSHDLPPFLTKAPGLNSGFMIAEVTTAALMSENKHLATPCSTDSTPTSANQEDHVSMAAHGARRLTPMVRNLERILGVEALCAAQGIEFRAPLATSAPLAAAVARLRADVPALGEDRFMAPDLEAAAWLVREGALLAASGAAFPELGGVMGKVAERCGSSAPRASAGRAPALPRGLSESRFSRRVLPVATPQVSRDAGAPDFGRRPNPAAPAPRRADANASAGRPHPDLAADGDASNPFVSALARSDERPGRGRTSACRAGTRGPEARFGRKGEKRSSGRAGMRECRRPPGRRTATLPPGLAASRKVRLPGPAHAVPRLASQGRGR